MLTALDLIDKVNCLYNDNNNNNALLYYMLIHILCRYIYMLKKNCVPLEDVLFIEFLYSEKDGKRSEIILPRYWRRLILYTDFYII